MYRRVCNSKCLHAKGPDCECACNGRNHGKHEYLYREVAPKAPQATTGRLRASPIHHPRRRKLGALSALQMSMEGLE
jgi:hypothetical protein